MTRLEIGLLGRFEVRRDGAPVALGSQRTEALFAYLLMTGRPQSRDHLVDLLWEDHRIQTAPGNLRVLFTNLRKSVGDFLTITRSGAAFLAPPDGTWALDVHVLEQRSETALGKPPEQATPEDLRDLRAALEVCRGEFLERLDLTSGTRFDEWTRRQRDRLGERRRAVLVHVIRAELANGNIPDALRHAEDLVTLEPLDESAHQLVIRALVAAGDMDGAAQRFEVLERTLHEELGTAPSPATRALFMGLPGGRRPGTTLVPPRARRANDTPRAPWSSLGGRIEEQRTILRVAAAARKGRGGLVVVRGVLGSGKSMLVRSAVRTLLEEDADWVALGGASTALLPGSMDGDLAVDAVAGQLSGDVGGSWLGGSMPEMVADRIWEHTRERAGTPVRSEGRLEAAVAGELRALAAGHPVILVLENLQWASPGTIGLLLELASDLRRRRILVMVTMRPWHRPGEVDDLADLLVPRLRRTAAASVLDLELEGRARSDMVRALAGTERHQLPDDLLVEVERLTGGHPGMAVELLRDLVRRRVVQQGPGGLRLTGLPEWPSVPERVGVLVDEWLSGLSGEARTLLEAAAALDVVDVEHLAVLTGRPRAEVQAVLVRELCRRSWLLAPMADGRFRFRQPLVRQHLRAGLGMSQARADTARRLRQEKAGSRPVGAPQSRRPS